MSRTILSLSALALTALTTANAAACGGGGGYGGGYGGYGGYSSSRYSHSSSYGYRQPSYSQPASYYQQPVQQQPIQQPFQQQQFVQQPQQVLQQQPQQVVQQPVQQQPAIQQQPTVQQQPVQQPAAQPVAATQSALEALGAFGGTAAPAPQQGGSFVGTFTATVNDKNRIQLQLGAGGQFRWTAVSNGKVSTFEGNFTIANGQLTLIRSTDSQQLAGAFSAETSGGFRFKLSSANDNGLLFVRG